MTKRVAFGLYLPISFAGSNARLRINKNVSSYGTTEDTEQIEQSAPEVIARPPAYIQDPNAASDNDGGGGGGMAEEEGLVYGATHVIKLFVPVTLCIFLVVVTINLVSFYVRNDGVYLVYTPFHELSDETGTKLWNAVANSLILMVVIVIMTFLLIVLYKYKFYKTIHAW